MALSIEVNGTPVAQEVTVPLGVAVSLTNEDNTAIGSLSWEITSYPERQSETDPDEAPTPPAFATNFVGWTLGGDLILSRNQSSGGGFPAVTFTPDLPGRYGIRISSDIDADPVTMIIEVTGPQDDREAPAAGENAETGSFRGWARNMNRRIQMERVRRGWERVYNGTGSALAAGKVVRVTNSPDWRTLAGNAVPGGGATARKRIAQVAILDGTAEASKTFKSGVIKAEIANGAFGWIQCEGIYEGNFGAYSVGDKVYVNATGDLTATETLVCLGSVTVADATGAMFVQPFRGSVLKAMQVGFGSTLGLMTGSDELRFGEITDNRAVPQTFSGLHLGYAQTLGVGSGVGGGNPDLVTPSIHHRHDNGGDTDNGTGIDFRDGSGIIDYYCHGSLMSTMTYQGATPALTAIIDNEWTRIKAHVTHATNVATPVWMNYSNSTVGIGFDALDNTSDMALTHTGVAMLRVRAANLWVGVNGDTTNPAIAFANYSTTGINADGSRLSFVQGGTSVLQLLSAFGIYAQNSLPFIASGAGSAAAPAFQMYSFGGGGYTCGVAFPSEGSNLNGLTLNTMGVERARADNAGNFIVGTAALATNAGNGYPYIPTMAGTPTGAPPSYTGRSAYTYDTTNDLLYFLNGTWKPIGSITGTGSNTQVAYWTGARVLAGSGNFTWNGSALAVTGDITASADISATGRTLSGSGSAVSPSQGFNTNTGLGLFRNGLDAIGFAAGGVLRMTLYTNALESGVPFMSGTDGAAATPVFTWGADQNTGRYRIGSDDMADVTNGTIRLRYDALGNVVLGTGALLTTATDGFLYISTLPGTPTGVATAHSGRAPLAFDSSNNLLYAYNSGWQKVGISGSGVANRVAYWSGSSTLAGSASFTWNGSALAVTGDITATANIAATGRILTGDGTYTSPSHGFNSTAGLGLFSGGANQLSVATGGVTRATFYTNAVEFTYSLGLPNGTAGAPAFYMSSYPTTGMWGNGANAIGFSTSGTNRMTIYTNVVESSLPFYAPNGAVGSPSYSFSNSTGTGLYLVSAGYMGISTSGNIRMYVADTVAGATVVFHAEAGIRVPVGSLGTMSIRNLTVTNTGIYFPSSDSIGFATNGADVAQFSPNANLLVGTTTDGSTRLHVKKATHDTFVTTFEAIGGLGTGATAHFGKSRYMNGSDEAFHLLWGDRYYTGEFTGYINWVEMNFGSGFGVFTINGALAATGAISSASLATGAITGTTVTLDSSSRVANGTVATVLGSLGPAAASTTVQRWLKINLDGIDSYIPCF